MALTARCPDVHAIIFAGCKLPCHSPALRSTVNRRRCTGKWRPSRVRQAHGALRVCASSKSAGSLRRQISDLVKSDLYSKYAQGAVFVGVLAAVDAGYSGDWSRIGAISTETEDWLKQVLPLLAAFHMFSAVVSGSVASRAGRPWQWPVVKAAAVGGLAMFEQLLQLDE